MSITAAELLKAYERGGFTVRQLAVEHDLSKSTAADMLKRARADRERDKLQQQERRRTADRTRKRSSRAAAAQSDTERALSLADDIGIVDPEILESIAAIPSAARRVIAICERDLVEQCAAFVNGKMHPTARQLADAVRRWTYAESMREHATEQLWLDQRRCQQLGDDDLAVVHYFSRPRSSGPGGAIRFDRPAAMHVPTLRNSLLLEHATSRGPLS